MAQSYTLHELARVVSGRLIGDGNIPITGFNSIERADVGELTFITNSKLAGVLADSRASGCIVPHEIKKLSMPQIVVDDPDLATAILHNFLLTRPFVAGGIHERAVIGKDCTIPAEVTIGPLVCLGDRVRIGERVILHPGVVIGDDVEIGDDCVLHANVVVAHGCSLGCRVILHHGAVIGSDGFGFATDRSTGCHVSKPQVGTVRLEDDVQIGANSCVDRAAFGTTRIRAGVRIDNQVMIGHNVEIGENTAVAAQTGISGSTRIGNHCILAGQTGFAGHLNIADGTTITAQSGVGRNIKTKNTVYEGSPAFKHKDFQKSYIHFRRLNDLVNRLNEIEHKLKKLMSE
ncbi:MAG: UDP-3-O-(3-hydroxymyristoyl)glucosamine N-acyltransferase [Bacteroidales bacterium]|nr:UDP-3-O-(3-hydroxymyristoyl)glucosamine N-acyltransferase [Bacteroidales bacterium]